MESISLEKREVVLDILQQIKESIENLMEWNHGITDMNQLLMSPSGKYIRSDLPLATSAKSVCY